MKKFVALFLSGLMAASLAACGDSSSASNASAGAEDDHVTLTLLTFDGAKNADGELYIQQQVDAYMAQNPNVTINIDMQSENDSVKFLEKLDLMQLSGMEADIVILPGYPQFEERARNGYFRELNDLLEAEGVKYEDLYDYSTEVDGNIYAIPYNLGIYHVLINKTLMEQAGLEAPPMDWTWEDYAEYAKAMTSGTGADKVYGSYMHTWTEYRREGLFNSKYGNPYIKEDGTSNMDDPNLRNWLQFIYDMENVDGSQIPYSDAKATNMAYRDVFFQGKAAMILTGSWIYGNINDTENFPHDFETLFAPMPTWGDGEPGLTQGGTSYFTVTKNSQNPEEAYRFIRWMSNEGAEVVGLFPSEKGTDYTKVIKDKIKGYENLYDVDSLLAVWNNPNLKPNIIDDHLEHFADLDALFNTESEKFMIGGQDLDTTIANLEAGAADILE